MGLKLQKKPGSQPMHQAWSFIRQAEIKAAPAHVILQFGQHVSCIVSRSFACVRFYRSISIPALRQHMFSELSSLASEGRPIAPARLRDSQKESEQPATPDIMPSQY
jgi:hypothetical protein